MITRRFVVQNGKLKAVKMLCERGVNVCSRLPDGTNALQLAAAGGHVGVVDFLCQVGVDVNERNRQGVGALALAVLRRHNGVVRRLVRAGAVVNNRDCHTTPLLIAVSKGDLERVKLLVDCGADVNLRAPLLVAAANGALDICQYLVTMGAKVDASNAAGHTPLGEAQRNGREQVVEFLRAHGA